MNSSNQHDLNARIERLEAELARVHAQRARRRRHRIWLLVALITIPAAAVPCCEPGRDDDASQPRCCCIGGRCE